MRVELSNGAWADLREPSELRSADRKAVNRVVSFHVDENSRPIFSASMDDDMAAACLRRVITQWSFPMPLPKDDPGKPPSPDQPDGIPGSLDKLELEDEDLLRKAVEEHMKLLKGDVNPVKRGTDPTSGSES